MATWTLSPQYKKSAVEIMFFRKENMVISIEQGFRWATFKVESDERPLTDEELKNEDGYELGCIASGESWEMWEMVDGCWLDIDRSNSHISDEEYEAFEAAWEANSFEGVEGLGWSQDDTEYYYHGPLALTNEDTGEEFQGEPDNIEQQLDPEASITHAEIEELREEAEHEVTDWYPATVNPVRNGVYEVTVANAPDAWPFPIAITKAEWNGKKWDATVTQWRGLTKEVK